MTIPRVWPTGIGSMPLSAAGMPMLASADAAQLDANLQQAVDKFHGSDTNGTITVPSGSIISLDSSGAAAILFGDSPTGTGGRWVCANYDYPCFATTGGVLSTLTLADYGVSFAEMFVAPSNPGTDFWPTTSDAGPVFDSWIMDPAGGMTCNNFSQVVPNGAAVVPLTRIHDGSLASGVTFTLEVQSGRGSLPSARYPGASVVQFDPFRNVWTLIGPWTYLPAAGSPSAYAGIHTLEVLFASGVTIDVSQYVYFICILDEDYGGDSGGAAALANEWTAAFVNATVADMRFG